MVLKKGFGLIELVIAMAISTVISVILFSSFWQIQRNIKKSDSIIELDRTIAVLQNQLEKDTAAIFIPEQSYEEKLERVFYSVNENDNVKEFTFITTNSLQVYNSLTPKIVRVTYQLKENKVNKNSFVLYRRESNNLVYGAEKDAVEYEIASDIKKLSLEFISKAAPKKEDDKEGSKKDNIKKSKEWGIKEPNTKKGETYKIPDIVIASIKFWENKKHINDVEFEFRYPIYSPKELKPKPAPQQVVGDNKNAPQQQQGAKPVRSMDSIAKDLTKTLDKVFQQQTIKK